MTRGRPRVAEPERRRCVQISLSPRELARLDRAAARDEVSRSEFVRRAADAALARAEREGCR